MVGAGIENVAWIRISRKAAVAVSGGKGCNAKVTEVLPRKQDKQVNTQMHAFSAPYFLGLFGFNLLFNLASCEVLVKLVPEAPTWAKTAKSKKNSTGNAEWYFKGHVSQKLLNRAGFDEP